MREVTVNIDDLRLSDGRRIASINSQTGDSNRRSRVDIGGNAIRAIESYRIYRRRRDTATGSPVTRRVPVRVDRASPDTGVGGVRTTDGGVKREDGQNQTHQKQYHPYPSQELDCLVGNIPLPPLFFSQRGTGFKNRVHIERLITYRLHKVNLSLLLHPSNTPRVSPSAKCWQKRAYATGNTSRTSCASFRELAKTKAWKYASLSELPPVDAQPLLGYTKYPSIYSQTVKRPAAGAARRIGSHVVLNPQ